MSITYLGSVSNPTDNSDLKGDPGFPCAIDKDAGLLSTLQNGDLIYAYVCQRDNGTTLSNSTSGGQTWNALTAHNIGTTSSSRGFWAQFNGTWTADPAFDGSFRASYANIQVVMYCFRPSGSSGATWAVDVAQSTGNSTPGGSPYAVTATGQDPVDATSTLTLVNFYHTGVANPAALSLQTGGWTDIGSFRSKDGDSGDIIVEGVYKFTTDGSATGNVTTNTNGSVQVNWTAITFKDQSPASSNKGSMLLLGV